MIDVRHHTAGFMVAVMKQMCILVSASTAISMLAKTSRTFASSTPRRR
jgi:hypothetical protein